MWAGVYSHHRPGDQITGVVGSAGAMVGNLPACPEGWQWYVERATAWSNTNTATGLLELFVVRTNAAPAGNDKGGRQDVFWKTDVQEAGRSYAAPIVVEPGYFLVASWTGLTQNDLVAVTFQVRLHQLPKAGQTHRHGHHAIPHEFELPATAEK